MTIETQPTTSRNRTTVGLKALAMLSSSTRVCGRNRTTVGLKEKLAKVVAASIQCRNRTTVGLKGLFPPA